MMFRRVLIGLNFIAVLMLWSFQRAYEAMMMFTGDIGLSWQSVAFPIAIIVAADIWYITLINKERGT